jgi:hypothetical protein
MPNTREIRCPACNGPTAIRASVRIEYREWGGDTYVDEVETDARRCANAACIYAFTDLGAVTEPQPLC